MTGVANSTRWTSVLATAGKLNIANRMLKAAAYINVDLLEVADILHKKEKKKYEKQKK